MNPNAVTRYPNTLAALGILSCDSLNYRESAGILEAVTMETHDKIEARKKQQAEYRATAAGKAAAKRSKNKQHGTEAYKRGQAKYRASAKGKAVEKRAREKYRKTEEYKENARKDAAKYRKRHRQKVNAHGIVNRAVAAGKLTRPDECSKCGIACKPEGHHDDYDKPLDVRWLCKACHVDFHQQKARVSV